MHSPVISMRGITGMLIIVVFGGDFMSRFWYFFKYELKNFFNKRNVLIFLAILVIALLLVQYSVGKYNKELSNIKEFQDVESKRIEQYFNYRIYGSLGFRLLFSPHPMAILFLNSTSIQEMIAFTNAGDQLKIYKPLQGKAVFESTKSLFTDFSGIIFFIATLARVS